MAAYDKTATRTIDAAATSGDISSSISRNACLKNSIRLSELISEYRQHYQISHLGIQAIYFIVVPVTILAAEAFVAHKSDRDIEKQHLSSLSDALTEVSEELQLAARPVKVLSELIATATSGSGTNWRPDSDFLKHLVAPMVDHEEVG